MAEISNSRPDSECRHDLFGSRTVRFLSQLPTFKSQVEDVRVICLQHLSPL